MNYRHTFNRLFLFALSLLFGLSSCKNTNLQDAKPNFVFIFIDDMGWKDVGFMGAEYYETPNIDKLAEQGIVFTQAYANAANCAPTRACLLSGQYSPRHGVFTVARPDRGDPKERRLIPTENTRTVTLEHVFISEALKSGGYKSAAFGKWNVGNSPEKQGFDVADPGRGFNGHFNDEGVYLGDYLTDQAVKFIEENNPENTGNPFFLYLSHYAVHTPIEAKEELIEKYKEKEGSGCHNNPVYAGMIESVDESVARVHKVLEEQGLSENTLLIFFSDNGGHGTYTCQKPLRGGKGMYYEGGIREPMFAYWPKTVKPGTVCEEPVISTDFYPTFLDLAGLKNPNDYILDGESIAPLLAGEKSLDREAIFWHFPAYLQSYEGLKDESRDTIFRTRPVSVIRKGDWKLLQFHEAWVLDGGREGIPENKAVELYNLAKDMGENNNLAAVETEKRNELLNDLLKWQEEIGAPVPTEINPEYKGH